MFRDDQRGGEPSDHVSLGLDDAAQRGDVALDLGGCVARAEV
jgi:hypothetical protein